MSATVEGETSNFSYYAGKRESIDLVQTVTAFGKGTVVGAIQTKAEIKKNSIAPDLSADKPLQEHHVASNKNQKIHTSI